MANHVGRPPGGRYGEDPGPEIYGNDSVGLFSPWTGRGDHGDRRGTGSSFPFPSSDSSPMLHVPSVGPGGRYTAGSVPLVQRLVRILTLVLAIRMFMSDGSRLLV